MALEDLAHFQFLVAAMFTVRCYPDVMIHATTWVAQSASTPLGTESATPSNVFGLKSQRLLSQPSQQRSFRAMVSTMRDSDTRSSTIANKKNISYDD